MKPYGSNLTKSHRYCLFYEKDHKFNIGIRSKNCSCSLCIERHKGQKRGKQFRTSRTNIKNTMRVLKKKERQNGKRNSNEYDI